MRKFALVAAGFTVGFFVCYFTTPPTPSTPPAPVVKTVIALDSTGQWAADLAFIGQSFNEDGSVRVFVRAPVTSHP